MKHYSEIIIIDPTIRFGKPTIKGTRISVYDVLSLFASGMSLQEIIDEIDNKLRTKYFKIAFNNIKRLTITHPEKRNGDFMKYK